VKFAQRRFGRRLMLVDKPARHLPEFAPKGVPVDAQKQNLVTENGQDVDASHAVCMRMMALNDQIVLNLISIVVS
jgi:hypothetical protein